MELSARQRSLVLAPEGITLSEPYVAAIISEMLAVKADGTGATCRLGLTRPSGPLSSVVDYAIYDVDFDTGAVRRVADLVAGPFL
jgi:hypothetical protein